MKALVLSGGGSKGSYQIGVWKALNRLHIKFDIVTGTSAGALNGALITQNTFFRALSTWKKINFKLLFGEDAIESNKQLDIYKMYGKNIIKNGGMNATEIESIIREALNIKKFYKSKINYGLVTYNLSAMKPLELEKKDIKEDQLVDYLMASATCYPAFQKKDIDGSKYIDGGFYDNLPINLALKMGADDIIAVDLRAPGLKRITHQKDNVNITIIKPHNKLTNFLNFYEEGNIRNIKLGYNDTMKVFHKYEGKYFTFKKGHLEKNRLLHQETYDYIIKKVLNSPSLIQAIRNILHITSTSKTNSKDEIFLKIVETTGKSFSLDETKIYSYKQFNKLLKKELKAYLKGKEITSKKIKTIIDLIKLLQDNKIKELRKKALLTPLELLQAIYLYTLYEV